ncbi:cob(I)yrinic acid a,c-diamide adenosyltransferase [Enterococcus malodoratus]|uniref:Corrinoid adenosyltransferase n=1 Tax=Enterococcus malodoratus ATCC 43197 TaxID=1158601 RepID=R2RIX6_9ENTE|nr:cob(I)yrinic acid a,c-diamide adenosyltransferase [Enterococcus malodoratus]EOH80541.1 ATP:cob(I)alamin adenosyltransferase [Enterococcus malodoratus ATCC 43197]EOT69050.1 ATP:cob(I)alamin adenosyltransferase [Enterococcus malodoratus ATCC 43197]OJG62347.1 ATP:cob(I)alamin adenosyltransferase [Enterococcus malodoratus]SPW67248.1 ATP:cob(I)alamin adenosyltransferase [Enterococcus malodoratus]STC71594.1 ATP:cob(I)alamin adenosyltransferase [Enterococcus malodoratus]
MNVYTRYGDQGFTRLVGGERVKKNVPRVQAYGSIDTLNAQVGFTVASLGQESALYTELVQVQQWIFDCGSDFATPEEKRPYKVEPQMIEWLEEKIDFYWEESPKIDRFVLPGGTIIAASLHLCRCFTREAERNAIDLVEQQEAVNEEALKFLNRLSDYFFALARWVNGQAEQPEILYENSVSVFNRKK